MSSAVEQAQATPTTGTAGSSATTEADGTVKSYAGIPQAYFIEDVDAFMTLPENSEGVDKVLKNLDEQNSKYKFMEINLLSKRKRLRQQIPDLARSLEMIKLLKEQNENIETQFLLNEQVFVKACVPPKPNVCLWLGADVMLEYTLDDAEKLLEKNKANATRTLGCVDHDLNYLRDQLTTTEVNMARVYNWEIIRRTKPDATKS